MHINVLPDGRPAVVGEVVPRGLAEVTRATHAVVRAAQPPHAPVRQLVRVVQLRGRGAYSVQLHKDH